MSHLPPIETMTGDAIESKPVGFDFSKGLDYDETGEDGTWSTVPFVLEGFDPPTIHAALEALDIDWGREEDEGDDEYLDRLTDAVRDSDIEWNVPMMNYYYPLPHFDESKAEEHQTTLLAHAGSVTLVRVGDGYALALTGGGMDFSDQIIAAHMLIGYLPPIHFIDGPDQFRDHDEDTRSWLVAGCLKSLEIAQRRLDFKRANFA